ncbi:hypothetical protein MMC15_004586 [Xylographa vitiligo]|nr:hypothetical protein [Xylographa vitiligo]
MASGGVSGWGLYMGEATKKGDYIGEYVGEVISKDESEQRAKFDLIKLNEQAQPTIEPRRKGIAYKANKDPNRAPTLSKNGKRIGRPRKHAFNDQGMKQSAVMVEAAMEPKAKLVATATKRSHKRKIPLPVLVLDRVVDHENFEDILPSDENREDASSDSFHWSNDEEDEFKVTRPTSFEASRKTWSEIKNVKQRQEKRAWKRYRSLSRDKGSKRA